MKKIVYKAMAVLLTCVMMFTGCKGQNNNGNESVESTGTNVDNEQTKDKEQYLNLVLEEPSVLDYAVCTDVAAGTILDNIQEQLIRIENGKVIPAGAESWETSEDNLVWTIKIRENYWSDGEKVLAQHYVDAIKRKLNPETAGSYCDTYYVIKGAEEANKGEGSLDDIAVRAIDDSTLEITLVYPYSNLLEALDLYPEREDYIEKYGDSYGTEADKVICSGPFMVKSWTHDSKIVVEKNPHYWDKDNVYMNTVTWNVIPEEQSRIYALQNGELDSINVKTLEYINQLEKKNDLKKDLVTEAKTTFCFFNLKDKLMSNTNVRRAFTLAFDREKYIDFIYNGNGEPAYGMIPSALYIDGKNYRESFDIQPVQELENENDPKQLFQKGIVELGITDKPEDIEVELYMSGTDQFNKESGELFQQMLEQSLGCKIKLRYSDYSVYYEDIHSGDYQIAFQYWFSDCNLSYQFSLFHSDAAQVPSGYVSEKYDELIDKAKKMQEVDTDETIKLYQEAEKLLVAEDAVVAPILYNQEVYFDYNYVYGIDHTAFSTVGMKNAYTIGRNS